MSGARSRSKAGRAVRGLFRDLRTGWRYAWLTWFAGNPLMPRPLRWLVYRMFRFAIRTPNVSHSCVIVGRRLAIGPGTFVNKKCLFEAFGPIVVGAGCQLGIEVMILTSHHTTGPEGVSRQADYRGVTIGDRVWLASRVTVLPGVRIGSDIVVGAGAVVAKDLVEPGVYAGVPAKLVRAGPTG